MSLVNEMQVNTLDQLILTCIEQPAFASRTKEPFGQSIVKYAVEVVEETSVSNSYFPSMSESLKLLWPMFILLTETLRKV